MSQGADGMKSSPEQLERETETVPVDNVRRHLPSVLRMAVLAFAVLRAVKAVRRERATRRRRALVADRLLRHS